MRVKRFNENLQWLRKEDQLANKMAVNVHNQLKKCMNLTDEGLIDFMNKNKMEIDFKELSQIAYDFINKKEN